jgi:hypothetical protein
MMTVPVAASSRPAAKGLTSWSFSRFNAYTKCPLAAKLSIIDRLPQPESAAMSRGDSIHKQAASYISGEISQLPESLVLFKDLFIDLRARFEEDVTVEDTWALRHDWSVTTWDDWKECYVRIKTDAVRLTGNHIDILDFKTGKFSPQYNVAEYELQLELYSLGALLMYGSAIPDITVSPHLIYLDHGIVYPQEPKVYTLADIPRLKKEWEKRVQPMMNDRAFAPNPGQHCRWCSYSASKNGPCEF